MSIRFSPRCSIAALFVSLSLLGCNSNNNTPKAHMGMSDADAQQLEANHSEIKDAAAPKLNADTHYATGQLAESSNALDAAVREYNAALKIDPHHLPSMFRLGVVYAEAKHFDESINAWQNYLKATDYSAAGYGNLGFCYELDGRPDLAEAMYKKGLEKDDLNLLCRTNYGLMLAHHNHIPEAMQMWQPVLTPAEMHYNLASVYEAMGHNREARIEYQRAIDLDPKFHDAKTRMAQLDVHE
jgi:tetratricopeptide (TPR) repeat protein